MMKSTLLIALACAAFLEPCHADCVADDGTCTSPSDPSALIQKKVTVEMGSEESANLEELEELTEKATSTCTWSTAHSGSKAKCENGVESWSCVQSGHGQRIQCPTSHPKMCNAKWCGSGLDYCCETNCYYYGGERPCDGSEAPPKGSDNTHVDPCRLSDMTDEATCEAGNGCKWYGSIEHCIGYVHKIYATGSQSTEAEHAPYLAYFRRRGKDYNGYQWTYDLYRPQALTMSRQKADGNWEACADTDNCFHEAASSGYNYGVVSSTLKGTYQKTAVEWYIKCEGDSRINIGVLCSSLSNAKLRMWYNHQEVSMTSCGSGTKWTHKSVSSSDGDPVVRLELERDGSGDASAQLALDMDGSPSSYDECVSFKDNHGQCVEALVGTASPLRSDHGMQKDCLNGALSGNPECEAWKACFDTAPGDGKAVLLKVLAAFQSTSLLQVSAQPAANHSRANCIDDPDHATCWDPATMDVEAFDCNCFDDLEGKSSAEIHDAACNHAKVCCDWKANHCPTLLLEARSKMVEKSENGRERSLQGLDKSVAGKAQSC